MVQIYLEVKPLITGESMASIVVREITPLGLLVTNDSHEPIITDVQRAVTSLLPAVVICVLLFGQVLGQLLSLLHRQFANQALPVIIWVALTDGHQVLATICLGDEVPGLDSRPSGRDSVHIQLPGKENLTVPSARLTCTSLWSQDGPGWPVRPLRYWVRAFLAVLSVMLPIRLIRPASLLSLGLLICSLRRSTKYSRNVLLNFMVTIIVYLQIEVKCLSL